MPEINSPEQSNKDIRLLYVEDDLDAREELVIFLERRQYRMLVAKNGQEGLEIFLKERPEIVISDILMPEMNGLEMIREIKKYDAKVPTILLTAYFDPQYMQEAIELSVDHYVPKPVDLEKLLAAVGRCHENVSNRVAIEFCRADRKRLIAELQGALDKVKILSHEINQSVDLQEVFPPNDDADRQLDEIQTFEKETLASNPEGRTPAHKSFCATSQPSLQPLSDEIRQSFLLKLHENVFPYLDILSRRTKDHKNLEYINLVTENLRSLGDATIKSLSDPTLALTKREIMVADLIMHGKNTIQIADLLGLAPKSIESYRNRIRKKLRLNNQNTNLQQYLQSIFSYK
ncbi:MAG: response regulator [Deltaproteobacteria bacterium]|nr:response regulator [Deltaproteobacteria bacterium]